jgi:hypothetical protein
VPAGTVAVARKKARRAMTRRVAELVSAAVVVVAPAVVVVAAAVGARAAASPAGQGEGYL